MNRVLLIGNNRFTASVIAQVRGLEALTVMTAPDAAEAANMMAETVPDVVITHAESLIETSVLKTFGDANRSVFFIVLDEPDKWLKKDRHRRPIPLGDRPAPLAVSGSTIDMLSALYIEKKIAALESGADVYLWLLLRDGRFLSAEVAEAVKVMSGLASGPITEPMSIAEPTPSLPTPNSAASSDSSSDVGDLAERDLAERPLMQLCTSQCRLIQTYIHVALNRAQRYRDLSRINDWLSAVALVDALTQLSNRRAFDLDLPQQLQVSRQKGTPISLMVLDIDYFKAVNDRYGHLVGDDVLKQLAKRLLANMRFSDTPFRYGGEEFVIILNNTDLAESQMIAERLRHSIGSQPFELSHLLKEPIVLDITISIGLTELRAEDDAQGRRFLNRADQYLLKAKAAGRNRVVSG